MSFLFRRITSSCNIHSFQNLANDLNTLHKQLIFRSGNLGMLELDIIVGRWAKINVPSFSHKECLEYKKEILDQETPILVKYITGELPLPNKANLYLTKLAEYAKSPKKIIDE